MSRCVISSFERARLDCTGRRTRRGRAALAVVNCDGGEQRATRGALVAADRVRAVAVDLQVQFEARFRRRANLQTPHRFGRSLAPMGTSRQTYEISRAKPAAAPPGVLLNHLPPRPRSPVCFCTPSVFDRRRSSPLCYCARFQPRRPAHLQRALDQDHTQGAAVPVRGASSLPYALRRGLRGG